MPRSRAAAVEKPKADEKQKIGRTRPVRSTRQFLESSEQQIGQDRPRAMRSRGPAQGSLEAAHVEVVDRPVAAEKLEMLAFLEEPVTVLVHESTNPIDEPFPEVWNDGRCQRFQRGKEQSVKRKFVEVLARAKKTAYTQEKYKDANGDEAYRNVPHSALKYPFSVVSDPNPKGRDWLRGILAEA